jgi:hypothetical protein
MVQVFTYLGHYFAQEKEGGSFLDAPKAIKCYRTALKSNLLNEEAGWGLSELLMCAEGKTSYEVCALHVLPYLCLSTKPADFHGNVSSMISSTGLYLE